jgi:enoyl-CoA hydratase/carnithine racemase
MSDILTDIDGGVMTITLNRVDKKNSITSAMYASLADALQRAADDSAIRVVVLLGHETIFCAGNDIGDFLNRPPTTTDLPVHRFLRGIASFPKPIIAAVCGAAVGVGTTMLLHCDLVYAGDNATFSLPFVNLGLCPEAASSLLLPQMLGYHRAAEVMLFGEPIRADAALAMGLVNRVVPPAEVNALTQTQARKLATKPMSSLLEIKRLMKKGLASQVAQQMTDEGVSFSRMLQEPAAKEAFTAFLEKRKADFSRV